MRGARSCGQASVETEKKRTAAVAERIMNGGDCARPSYLQLQRNGNVIVVAGSSNDVGNCLVWKAAQKV